MAGAGNVRARLTKLERSPLPTEPAPVGWTTKFDGSFIDEVWISDPQAWPGYIAGLLRSGALRWEMTLSGHAICSFGKVWEKWTPERGAVAMSVDGVMIELSQEGWKLPENTQEMIAWLESLSPA